VHAIRIGEIINAQEITGGKSHGNGQGVEEWKTLK
jgi:hypothetical protein